MGVVKITSLPEIMILNKEKSEFEMFEILERHICKDIIQFRNIYYKKKTAALTIYPKKAQV